MPGFLSDAWFEAVRTACARVEGGSGDDGTIRFVIDSDGGGREVRSVVVLEDGRVVRFDADDAEDADVELRVGRDDAKKIFRGEMSGNDAITVVTMVEQRPDGRYIGPPVPLDLASRPELSRFPSVPGATLDFQVNLRDGPFGDCSYVLSFVDGAIANVGLSVPSPDLMVTVSFRNMIRFRRQEITLFDALESGGISGSEAAMMTMAGLLETPAYKQAMLACGTRGGVALGALGEALGTPGVRAAIAHSTE